MKKSQTFKTPVLLGGLGEMKSNSGTQYFQQDRVYSTDYLAMCHPYAIPGGSYRYLVENEDDASDE